MIDYQYIEVLQNRRAALWREVDNAIANNDLETARDRHYMAIGVSGAISALQTYDMEKLVIDRMEEALTE